MKHWKKLLIGVSAFGAAFVLIGFLLPARVRVERSAMIKARPEAVFPHVATLRRWPEWTAWTSNRFPDMKLRFEGPETGVGAVMVATGKASGDGKVTITDAQVATGIRYELDFNHGAQIFQAAVSFEPAGDDLRVVWSYEAGLGRNPLKRWAGLMFDLLMGSDLEAGLANLKRLAEHGR